MNALVVLLFAATVQRIPDFHFGGFVNTPDGKLYSAASYNGLTGVFRLTPDGPVLVAPLPSSWSSVASAPDGSFVFSNGDVYRTTAAGIVKIADGPFPAAAVASDGAVWALQRVGYPGVPRIAPNGAVAWFARQWQFGNAAAGRDATMWLESQSGILHLAADGTILSNTPIFVGTLPRIAPAPNGGVWVSAWNGARITRIDADETPRAVIQVPRGYDNWGFTADTDAVYVVSAHDLLRFRTGVWSVAKFERMPAPYSNCYTYEHAVAVDEEGRVWVAQIAAMGILLPEGMPPCPAELPLELRSALLRLDEASFVPLGGRIRAAGR